METEQLRQVKVFLLHGPRHNTKIIVDRAYPVLQFPIEKHEPFLQVNRKENDPVPNTTSIEIARYEKLMRSQMSGVWIYEYKESA